MRGAFGFGTRVDVATIATRVLVAPKIDVGDGPTVTVSESEVGAAVGVELNPGVRLAVGVSVMVEVGRSVGITCCTVAPQADRRGKINAANKLIFLKKSLWINIDGCSIVGIELYRQPLVFNQSFFCFQPLKGVISSRNICLARVARSVGPEMKPTDGSLSSS